MSLQKISNHSVLEDQNQHIYNGITFKKENLGNFSGIFFLTYVKMFNPLLILFSQVDPIMILMYLIIHQDTVKKKTHT